MTFTPSLVRGKSVSSQLFGPIDITVTSSDNSRAHSNADSSNGFISPFITFTHTNIFIDTHHYKLFDQFVLLVLSLFGTASHHYIIINTRGIVMHDNKWETTASPAATEVSFPAALGITIVFSPNGIANIQSEHIYTVEGNFQK